MLAGLVVLTGAGFALGDGLRRVVTSFDISPSLLGNTAIAAAVELEEVSRVAVPTRHGRSDIALANIFGTIAHFAAFNAGVIALVRPIHLDHATLHLTSRSQPRAPRPSQSSRGREADLAVATGSSS